MELPSTPEPAASFVMSDPAADMATPPVPRAAPAPAPSPALHGNPPTAPDTESCPLPTTANAPRKDTPACGLCFQVGHNADTCQLVSQPQDAPVCGICLQVGHSADTCQFASRPPVAPAPRLAHPAARTTRTTEAPGTPPAHPAAHDTSATSRGNPEDQIRSDRFEPPQPPRSLDQIMSDRLEPPQPPRSFHVRDVKTFASWQIPTARNWLELKGLFTGPTQSVIVLSPTGHSLQ